MAAARVVPERGGRRTLNSAPVGDNIPGQAAWATSAGTWRTVWSGYSSVSSLRYGATAKVFVIQKGSLPERSFVASS